MYHKNRIFLLVMLTIMISSPVFLSSFENISDKASDTSLAAESPFLRGPVVSKMTNTSTVIFWRTENATDAEVEYGLSDSNLNETITNSTLDTDHHILIDGLSPDTKYYYRVTSDIQTSDIYFFRTAPLEAGSFKLVVIGDNRPSSNEAPAQPEVYQDLIDLAILEEPHLVIMTGDYVYRVTDNNAENLQAWKMFNEVTDRLGHYAPILGVIGNHDTGAATGSVHPEYYFDAFTFYDAPSTYFSFDYAGVHFVFLDAEQLGLEGRITGTQYDWLVNDLSATTQPLKIVASHRPLYACSHIGSALDVNVTERDRLQSLFEDENVTLYFTGHDHLYNRLTVNGVTHIIAGGGGAPTYSTPWGGAFNHYVVANVSPSRIDLEAIKVDGTIGDTYQIPYNGPIQIDIRGFGNRSTQPAGSKPEVYFSEVPTTVYYSWDGTTNSTELAGIPNSEGSHSLQIYAEDSDGVWGYNLFTFTAIVETSTASTTTTAEPTDSGLTLILLITAGGVAAVIIVVILVKKFR